MHSPVYNMGPESAGAVCVTPPLHVGATSQDLLAHVAEYKMPMEQPELARAKVVADVIR